MSLKKAALVAGVIGAFMGIAPVASASAPPVIDGGQNIQNCGNIDVDGYAEEPLLPGPVVPGLDGLGGGGEYEPQDSPNFVKCTQVPNTENHPVKVR